jgi:hypothetical protein
MRHLAAVVVSLILLGSISAMAAGSGRDLIKKFGYPECPKK